MSFLDWVEETQDTEFSPTFEEFMWSYVKLPGHMLRGPSTEDLFYFDLHMAHFGVHYAWHASRVGGYAAWDTFAGWRMSQLLSRPYRFAKIMANPFGAVAAAGIVAAHHTLTSPPPGVFAAEPGQTSWWRSVAQGLTGGFGTGSYQPF